LSQDHSVTPEPEITLAAIIDAHGVTGEVRLKLFGEGVAGLKGHRAFNNSSLTVESIERPALRPAAAG
jgi:ribosomal 30S subunit maturation factor RimM